MVLGILARQPDGEPQGHVYDAGYRAEWVDSRIASHKITLPVRLGHVGHGVEDHK